MCRFFSKEHIEECIKSALEANRLTDDINKKYGYNFKLLPVDCSDIKLKDNNIEKK